MNSQRHKHLQVRKTQLISEITDLNKTIDQLKKDLENKTHNLQEIEKELRLILDVKPVVSEHALLRYVERVLGVNIKKIENEILTHDVMNAIETLHSGKIPYKDGMTLVIRDKTVITINPKD
jgi:chromosome segregation ATPase